MKDEEEKEYKKEETYKLEIKISKKINSESQIKYDFSLQSGGLWWDTKMKAFNLWPLGTGISMCMQSLTYCVHFKPVSLLQAWGSRKES